MGAHLLWRTLRDERKPTDKPHHVANMVLRACSITRPPVNVYAIAQKLGVNVVKRSVGFAGQVEPFENPPRITVNADDAITRQRFTVAHEIGHLMLHDPQKSEKYMRDSTFARRGDRIEEEANEFAASLLIPLWMLEPIAAYSSPAPRELANFFQVSQNALVLQLRKIAG